MTQTLSRVLALATLALGLPAGVALAADVNIGINIGAPPPVVVAPAPAVVVAPAPPAIVLPSPPSVVLVPGSAVYRAPGVSFNLFLFNGRYYSFHNGHWFHSASYNGPWLGVAVDAVPRPVLGVPVTYYKVPPGHARKAEGGGGHCPPGQAKKGRC